MPAWDGLVRVLVAVTGRNELRSEQLERGSTATWAS